MTGGRLPAAAGGGAGAGRTPGGRPGTSGIASDCAIAAAPAVSGNRPSIGPIRATTRPAPGAATHPAVA